MNNALKVNAWLERSDPFVELRNTRTGKVVLSVNGDMLHEILSMANISHDELYSDKHILEDLIEELFSAHVADALGIDVTGKVRRKKPGSTVVKFHCKTNTTFNSKVADIRKLVIE